MLLGLSADESLGSIALSIVVVLHNVTQATETHLNTCGVRSLDCKREHWGCMAYIRPPETRQSTQGALIMQGMDIGYDMGSKAYRDGGGRRLDVSLVDVRFMERKNGGRAAIVERGASGPHVIHVDFWTSWSGWSD
jgi:hypothetical protein